MNVRAAILLAAIALAGCGDDSPTSDDSTVVVRDITLTLVQGVTCATGAATTDFVGVSGKTVTISASGSSSMHPAMVLYAPDYTTQLASSTANGTGKAKITFALTASGTHYVNLCDEGAVGGAVRVTVTQPAL